MGWLQERNLTKGFRLTIRRHFLKAYRQSRPVMRALPLAHARAEGLHLLGRGEQPRDLYQHQRRVRRALDEALDRRGDEPMRAQVVLPTGSGKTFAVTGWLLQQLAKNPSWRVLWLSHQRELLDQSALEFGKTAAELKPGFERLLRVVPGMPNRRRFWATPVLNCSVHDPVIAHSGQEGKAIGAGSVPRATYDRSGRRSSSCRS